MTWQNPRTANPAQSIWHDLPEETFRQHLVELEEHTNAIPTDMQIFSMKDWLASCEVASQDLYTLPLVVEQQLADDFAFLSAVEEGAQSVAAACLEETQDPPNLTVRFAALDLSLSEATKAALHNISGVLADVASKRLPNETAQVEYVDKLYCHVTDLHCTRLLARLRSAKWQKPKYLDKSHKKPLWQDFANLSHRVQFIYPGKKGAAARQDLEPLLIDLASVYESFETVPAGSREETSHMQRLVRKSFDFCSAEQVRLYAHHLQKSVNARPTKQIGSAIKCLRQIEKIGAYWRISISLVNAATRYPTLFADGVAMAYLSPYTAVPTSVGYEAWAKTCHVHAEVQLAVYYDLLPHSGLDTDSAKLDNAKLEPVIVRRPRAIGTSKYLCYLCYQFLKAHRRFFPSNTHGRLYDQWTIPDLMEFDDHLTRRYRHVINAMDDQVMNQVAATTVPTAGDDSPLARLRAEPMTSRQNLLEMDVKTLYDVKQEDDGNSS